MFKEKLKEYFDMISTELDKVFSVPDVRQKSVYDAMRYSIMAGGKRIRPVLTLAVCDMLGGDMDAALRFGIAIECIHTYSLIHDDLPCMDNDDLRRGKPTCHKVFGETNALLAGDGLLTFAFEYLSDNNTEPEKTVKLISCLAKAAGCEGMIGGQVVDLESEGRNDINEEMLTYMHNRKTGALIKSAVVAGGMCADASSDEIKALEKFADGIGLVFQIMDDILDCVGDETKLGKPIGSDDENEKITYANLLGIDNARKKAEELNAESTEALRIFGDKAEFLIALAQFLIEREK